MHAARARAAPRAGAGLRLPHLRGRAHGAGTSRSSSARSTRAWATCCPRGTSTSRSTTGRRASLSFPYFADERDTTPAPEAARAGPDGVRPAHRPAAARDARGLPRASSRAARSSSSPATPWTGWGRRSWRAARRSGWRRSRPTTPRCASGRRSATSSSSSAGRSPPRSRRSGRRTRCGRARPGCAWRSSRCRPSCGRPTRSCASPRRWAPASSALGLAPNQVVGTVARAVPRGRERWRSIATGSPCGASRSGYEYETDGRAFTVHVEPLRDAAGAIRGTVGIALDITERASRRPGPARVGGAAAPGHRPRAALHLREGRGGPLPPREPGGGRGLRHRPSTGSSAAPTPTSPARRRRCGASARTTSR